MQKTGDRSVIDVLNEGLTGKIVGDKGYIKKSIAENLFARNLKLITKVKKNMKNILMPLIDKVLLRKRAIVETVNDQLKNISQIEHTRHRSIFNFATNVICGIIAYCLQPRKPSLNLNLKDLSFV